MSDHDPKGYWKSSIKIVFFILVIWFTVSYGCAILFKESLDVVKIGGAPLGFWMAQQGAIVVFVLLLVLYAVLMNKLDHKHGYDEASEAAEAAELEAAKEKAAQSEEEPKKESE